MRRSSLMSGMVRGAALAALVFHASGCVRSGARPAGGPTAMSAAGEWSSSLLASQAEVRAGRYDEAERILSNHAAARPDTPGAREADFWRATVLIDPANPRTNPAAALELLQRYVSDTASQYRSYALLMERLATTLVASRQQVAAPVASPRDGSSPQALTAREQELLRENQRLKDQLDRTNLELERIKRRLGTPRP